MKNVRVAVWVVMAVSGSQILFALNWTTEIVQDSGVGHYNSLAVDSSGNPYIAYKDYRDYLAESKLMLAVYSSSSWKFVTVDNNVGSYMSLALDGGTPTIAYVAIHGTARNINYARWNGWTWDIQKVLNGNSRVGVSLALDSSGSPHVSYSENYLLQYSNWDGSNWNTEGLDDDGAFSSIVLDSSDSPRISYHDGTVGLKYASLGIAGWTIEVVDGSYSHPGSYSSLALDRSGRPRISYYDTQNRDLKYASWSGTDWDIQIVDSEGLVGSCTSLVLDDNDNPHISYYDQTNRFLKYAAWDGSSWIVDTVWDRGGDTLENGTSIALDDFGNIHIAFSSGSGNQLVHAVAPLPEPATLLLLALGAVMLRKSWRPEYGQ